jgi:hypothetical protein
MDEAMTGKSPLLVVGWLGRTGYQTVIHEAARQEAQASQAARVDKLEAMPQPAHSRLPVPKSP